MPMRSFRGKQVLSLVREGDFAHPGNEEPVKIMMRGVQPDKNRLILDVACGLGGTAQYIYEQGLGRVVGIDLDAYAIEYAKETYPEIKFHVADVVKTHEVLQQQFDLIYICGSLLCFPDQLGALQSLRQVAKDDAKLVLFDLADLSDGTSSLISNDKDRVVRIISLDTMKNMLNETGWELLTFEDLSGKCAQWYAGLLNKIRAKKSEIVTKFGEYEYESALTRYTDWHREIDNGQVGFGIYRARVKN